MRKLENPDKGEREAPDFGTAPGDIGVVVIAAICTLTFIGILFSHWNAGLAKGIAAAPVAKVQPNPETEMLLFPPAGGKAVQNPPPQK